MAAPRLALLLSVIVALLALTVRAEVLELTDANFESTIAEEGKLFFVKFFAPWCGHCKRLAPTWEELGEAVSDDNVAIALVDCTSSRDTCSQQGIRGYPTLKVLLNGKEHKKYEGARDFESLRTFITEEAKQVEQLATAAA